MAKMRIRYLHCAERLVAQREDLLRLSSFVPSKPHHPRVVLLVLDALAGAPPRRSQSYRFDRLLQPP
jgi:hypothetical protein